MNKHYASDDKLNWCSIVERAGDKPTLITIEDCDTLAATNIAELFCSIIRSDFRNIFDNVIFAIPGKNSNNYRCFEERTLSINSTKVKYESFLVSL